MIILEKDLVYFIDEVTKLDSFWKTNYYMRCLKKQPHGGVGHIFWPNYYLKHRPADTFWLFCNYNRKIPAIFQSIVDDELRLWKECNIDIEELLYLCFDDDNFWYVGFRVLKEKPNKKMEGPLLWYVIDHKLKFQDYFDLDNLEEILYAFAAYLMYTKMLELTSIEEIQAHENLLDGHNKYGLNEVCDVQFSRQGFIIGDQYYLYNLFLDTSIGWALADVPLTIEILQSIPDAKLFMRCDRNVAVTKGSELRTATVDAQKFRGISVALADIEMLVSGKELVIHFNPDTLNKLLLIIKRDVEPDGATCFHIELEELWNPEKVHDDVVAVNYLHAKYLPSKKGFNHIDFSVNQYRSDIFKLKYGDAVNDNAIPIDKYADFHYKIWCVECETISVSTWSTLVSATLDEPFRDLFCEMFPNASDDEC